MTKGQERKKRKQKHTLNNSAGVFFDMLAEGRGRGRGKGPELLARELLVHLRLDEL